MKHENKNYNIKFLFYSYIIYLLRYKQLKANDDK